ncbi:MAG: ATP-binding protein [Actinomycetota bacterium]
MNERIASRLSLWLAVVTIATAGASFLGLAIGTAVTYGGGDHGSPLAGLVIVVVAAAASLLGRLIVHRAHNVIGWAFQAMALAAAVSFGTELIIQFAAETAPSSGVFGMDLVQRPSPETGALKQVAVGTGLGIELLGWLNRLSFLGLVLPIPLIFLSFPTGRPLSPRWRWAIRLWMASVSAAVAWAAFKPTDVFGSPPAGSLPGIHIDAPFGVHGVDPVFDVLATGGIVAGLLAGVLGAASLVLRFRRAHGEERAQLKWLALVGGAAATIMVVLNLTDVLVGDDALSNTIGSIGFVAVSLLLLLGVPLAVAVAILKYRLYDVNVVINKAVVYGTLAVFITAVYVGLVVGVAAVLGRTGEPNVALEVAAMAAVAVAFQPVRERAQRFANRVVYGKRATPYEVLSGIARRAGDTFATEEVLPRMARIIAEGTGAARVDVCLRSDDLLVPAASWPVNAEPVSSTRLDGGDLPELPAARRVAIRHQGELLGTITVDKPRGEQLTAPEARLLDDLASHAGLVLRNVSLTGELRRRLHELETQAAELTASRQRIVAAQDAERRRLERNIHDGAQQHLVALAVKLRLARTVATRDPTKAKGMLVELDGQLGEALDTLIDLARGIYPPLLEQQGLAPALAAQYLRGPLQVVMEVGSTRRYPIQVEAAAYFCILEALQNATKYANANQVRISLEARDGELGFTVIDDGVGFELDSGGAGTGILGMTDRVAPLGGEIRVDSAPGRGTTVAGRVPVFETEATR